MTITRDQKQEEGIVRWMQGGHRGTLEWCTGFRKN